MKGTICPQNSRRVGDGGEVDRRVLPELEAEIILSAKPVVVP